MATISEVREIDIRARTQGIDQATSSLNKLASADQAVAVASEKVERSTASVSRSLETLQRRVDQNYASTQQLARATTILDEARARDIISVNRHAELMALTNQRYGQMGNQLVGVRDKTKLASHEISQMGAQFSDIAVQLAGGQSPFLVMMQQGSQLSGQLGDRGLKGAIAALGTGLVSFVTNPLNLAIVGFGAAASAAAYFFSSSKDDADKTTKAIDLHADAIRGIKDAYGDAAKGLKDYARESVAVLAAQAKIRAEIQKSELAAQSQALLGRVGGGFHHVAVTDAMGNPTGMTEAVPRPYDPRYAAFARELDALRNSAAGGNAPDILGFREAVGARVTAGKGADFAIGKELLDATEEAAKAALNFKAAAEVLNLTKQALPDPEEQARIKRAVQWDEFMSEAQSWRARDLEREGKEQSRATRTRRTPAMTAIERRQSTLGPDLAFQREQLFRSEGEQEIASALRSAGYELNSASGQFYAEIMRTNAALKEMRDIGGDVFKTAAIALSNGEKPSAVGKAALRQLGGHFAEQGAEAAWSGIWSQVGEMFPSLKGIGLKRDGSSAASALYVKIADDLPGAIPVPRPGDVTRGAALAPPATADDIFIPKHVGLTAGARASAAAGGYAEMIRQSAAQYGIDPKIALRVAQGEGGTSGWIQSRVMKGGVREPSYGPFQALIGGPGTGFPRGQGNAMLEQGIDPRNPANAQRVIDWQMRYASQHGWREWYGAKAAGIGNRQGIGVGGVDMAAIQPMSLTTTTQNLDRFSATVSDSTKNVGSFGKDLGDVGGMMAGLGGILGAALGGKKNGALGGAIGNLAGMVLGAGMKDGGWLSSMFSGGGASPVLGAWEPSFAAGGYTGPGGVHERAGTVHRGEVVWSQADIARAGGVDVVEMMRAGRKAAGGNMYRSGDTVINISGNADDKTVRALRRELDERDRRQKYVKENEWRFN